VIWTDRVHGLHVHPRRVRVLCEHIVRLLPSGGRVLDVGCGDGLLARHIQEQRPDLDVSGVDVLVRSHAHISVRSFDGARIPSANGSVDVVLFVDVLHHTSDPMILLREAARVARKAIVIKDHTLEGFLAGPTLRLMDRIGNARHGVAIPHTYWERAKWTEAWNQLGLNVSAWFTDLKLYPWPADCLFGRELHFIARLDLA